MISDQPALDAAATARELERRFAALEAAIFVYPHGRRAPSLDAHLKRLQAMQRDRQSTTTTRPPSAP